MLWYLVNKKANIAEKKSILSVFVHWLKDEGEGDFKIYPDFIK